MSDLDWTEAGEEWLKSHPEIFGCPPPKHFLVFDQITGQLVSSVSNPDYAKELWLKLFEET